MADDAIFERAQFVVDGERRIRENELDTEIAVEQKKRQIRETQMEAEASLRRKKHELESATWRPASTRGGAQGILEKKAANLRMLAERRPPREASWRHSGPPIRASCRSCRIRHGAGQLIAQAFGGIAERAERSASSTFLPTCSQPARERPASERPPRRRLVPNADASRAGDAPYAARRTAGAAQTLSQARYVVERLGGDFADYQASTRPTGSPAHGSWSCSPAMALPGRRPDARSELRLRVDDW